MKIFMDTANVEEIAKFVDWGVVYGVTTNPSLIAKEGRDYAERPEFYLPYEGEAALKSLNRAKPLAVFLQKQPTQEKAARELIAEKRLEMDQLHYLPVVGRQDWVAVLDAQGQIQGFLKGDGF